MRGRLSTASRLEILRFVGVDERIVLVNYCRIIIMLTFFDPSNLKTILLKFSTRVIFVKESS